MNDSKIPRKERELLLGNNAVEEENEESRESRGDKEEKQGKVLTRHLVLRVL